jgi:hypothetical protein
MGGAYNRHGRDGTLHRFYPDNVKEKFRTSLLNFHEVPTSSAKFGLQADNMKFNTQKGRMQNISIIICAFLTAFMIC